MLSLCLEVILLLSLAVGALTGDEFSRADFPADFVFGAASSAYQVEGAAKEDGRTPSIWDTYAYAGFANGANADVACDGYHKYKEDVQRMVETGLEAWRFSISWSRLIPNGRGTVNPKGLEFYNNFINELVKHGIQPHVTLHHHDLPQVLEDEYGGWVSRKIIKDFTYYADVCFREFGDRVSHWSTINEPNFFAMGGYDVAIMPPTRCSSQFGVTNCTRGNSSSEPYIAVHHMLLAHASAVRLYRKRYQEKQHGFIGLIAWTSGFAPQTDTKEDRAAAERAYDFFVGWILDPLVHGDYPSIMKKNAGSRIPAFTDYESKLVKGSFDFIGLICYYDMYIEDNSNILKMKERDYIADSATIMKGEWTQSVKEEFAVTPWALRGMLEKFKQLYHNPPIYIYENGQRTKHGSSLLDVARVEYLNGYIGGVLDALRNGSNVRGYFVWSLIDLFELPGGYELSYGLYYVDFDDPELKRFPKLSQKWYSNFLKGNEPAAVAIELNKNLSASSNIGPLFQ